MNLWHLTHTEWEHTGHISGISHKRLGAQGVHDSYTNRQANDAECQASTLCEDAVVHMSTRCKTHMRHI